MKRLTRTVAAAALATALALVSACSGDSDSGSGSGDGASLRKVTYLTSFGNFGRDSYAWVAKEKGFFKEAGFDVDIKPGQGTGGVIQTVVGGQAQFGAIDLTGGLLQLGGGDDKPKDFVAVAAIQQRTMAAIVTTADKDIASPKDLEGKTLADTEGSVVRNLFPTYAKLAGIDSSKVKWVTNPAQALMGILAAGSVDGIGQFVVGAPTVRAVAKKEPVVLPYSNVMTDLYGNALITTKKLAKEEPEMVKSFTAALLKGLEYSLANTKEAGEILKKHVPEANPAAAAAELDLMAAYVRSSNSGTAIGALDSGRIAKSIAILQGAGALKQNITPEQVVDFDLAPKA